MGEMFLLEADSRPQREGSCLRAGSDTGQIVPNLLIPAHAQSVRHAIDVVEPGCDQCDLQDSLVIKTGRSQALMIRAGDACGIARKLRGVIKHLPVLL